MHAGIAIAALCLAVTGVLFLFAPQETGAVLLPGASGAALFVYLTFFSSGLRRRV